MWAPNTPASTGRVSSAGFGQHGLVECPPLDRRRGAAEAGPVAARGVGDERELRDDQQTAGHVLQAAVHAPGRVAEDAQFEQLVDETPDLRLAVRRLGADQHQQAGVDRADHLARHLDTRKRHPLHEADHVSSARPIRRN